MEITKVEIAAIEFAIVAPETHVKELDELELSLVGGGMGDVVFV